MAVKHELMKVGSCFFIVAKTDYRFSEMGFILPGGRTDGCLEKEMKWRRASGEKEGGTKSFHDATCKEGSPSILIIGPLPYNEYYEFKLSQNEMVRLISCDVAPVS